MKMIDRFISFSKELKKFENTGSLIAKWKFSHRKFEILKEIEDATEFNNSNIYNYLWIVDYAKSRYGDQYKLPENVSCFLISNVWRFSFSTKEYAFTLSSSINGYIDVTKSYFDTMGGCKRYVGATECITRNDDYSIFYILKEVFTYLIDEIISLMIKEIDKK